MIFTTDKVATIRSAIAREYLNGNLVEDRTGAKVVELINASFIADESSIFGTPDSDWNEREVAWYLTQSLNINDIEGNIPILWKSIATSSGEINSNYGWCVFSEENGFQYFKALDALIANPNSRQSIMIYTRPSMHIDSCRDGMKDFMCCTHSQFFIRDNTLLNSVYFRSNDAVYGYKGDLHWHQTVYDSFHHSLSSHYPDLIKTPIVWNAGSLHVYERHFPLIERFISEGK